MIAATQITHIDTVSANANLIAATSKSVPTICFASYGFSQAVPTGPEMVSEGFRRVSEGSESLDLIWLEMSV